jgi:hypothetical protein
MSRELATTPAIRIVARGTGGVGNAKATASMLRSEPDAFLETLVDVVRACALARREAFRIRARWVSDGRPSHAAKDSLGVLASNRTYRRVTPRSGYAQMARSSKEATQCIGAIGRSNAAHCAGADLTAHRPLSPKVSRRGARCRRRRTTAGPTCQALVRRDRE